MPDCFPVTLGIYPQIVGVQKIPRLETNDKVRQPRIDVPGSCDWTGTKFAAAILIDFWTRPLRRVRVHRRHNTSARYHPLPALQKYQLNPELYPVSQEVLLKISGVIRPNTPVVEDWVEKEDVEMEVKLEEVLSAQNVFPRWR
ncbi:hypothetical protein B0H14DRAFT_2637067 [Mycena olivaceomarginata]|nr:hypothetical protein B0H14DRAFT_2637067 [Mycena olivaceomarginata]